MFVDSNIHDGFILLNGEVFELMELVHVLIWADIAKCLRLTLAMDKDAPIIRQDSLNLPSDCHLFNISSQLSGRRYVPEFVTPDIGLVIVGTFAHVGPHAVELHVTAFNQNIRRIGVNAKSWLCSILLA